LCSPVSRRPPPRRFRVSGHEGRGYEIVADLGDQRSDLDGGATLRGFKLPNPMYLIPSA
jgi:hypothetical protein